MRSRVERFFRYLKERMAIFYHKLSARNHVEGIMNLKTILKSIHIILPNYKDRGRWMKRLSGHFLMDKLNV